MKKVIAGLIIFLFTGAVRSQSVGVGTITPDPSAQLDVSSTTKGFLPPRMTAAQRDSISSPTPGLMIFCTNCGLCGEWQGFNVCSGWTNLVGGATSPPEVTICTQRWMVKNLNVSAYRNGDPIPQVTDPTAWAGLTTGAWCYYNNDPAMGAIYGKLYNWYAVNDPRGLAPEGWHIPIDAEWTTLSTCLGGDAVAGGKMKEAGTTHWQTPNTGATNISGFTGLPGGYRNFTGQFFSIGLNGFFWCNTEFNSTLAYGRYLIYNDDRIYKNTYEMRRGYPVRCIKD